MDRPPQVYSDVNHVVVTTRSEATGVIESLATLQSDFGFATVSDLCLLLELTPTIKEERWGWQMENLRDLCEVHRTFNGLWLVKLPPATYLS